MKGNKKKSIYEYQVSITKYMCEIKTDRRRSRIT